MSSAALSQRNAACKAAGFFSLSSSLMTVSPRILVSSPNHPLTMSQSSLPCLCLHSSTSSMTAWPPLISLRGSWLCMLEESPRTVKTVTRMNLSVSLKNRLLGDITLPHLVAHWLGAVSLDPAASHFHPIYHSGTHSQSPHLNWLLFFCLMEAHNMSTTAFFLNKLFYLNFTSHVKIHFPPPHLPQTHKTMGNSSERSAANVCTLNRDM